MVLYARRGAEESRRVNGRAAGLCTYVLVEPQRASRGVRSGTLTGVRTRDEGCGDAEAVSLECYRRVDVLLDDGYDTYVGMICSINSLSGRPRSKAGSDRSKH